MKWTSLAIAFPFAVGSMMLFRAWKRKEPSAFADRTWLTDLRSQRLFIWGWAFGGMSLIFIADFIGKLG